MATSRAISSIFKDMHHQVCTRGPSSKAGLTQQHLENFRHELRDQPGLSSSAPWLMPNFWRFPDRFDGDRPAQRYLPGALHALSGESGDDSRTPRKVWAFVGDGESDEPESMGSLTLGSREKLDNLIFVVNCNLASVGRTGARQWQDH